MNLFGGSENYILNDFTLNCKVTMPEIKLTLLKIHTTESQISLSEEGEEDSTVVKMVVKDNYECNGDSIDLFIAGVGRFKIYERSESKFVFKLLKETVKNIKSFNLMVDVNVLGKSGTYSYCTPAVEEFKLKLSSSSNDATFTI